jgi:ferredoxin-NAD(P)+ reductase (naphthalene dioxygenase ferredoxin-specific)
MAAEAAGPQRAPRAVLPLQLQVLPRGATLDFQPGENLLALLLREGIPISYSCMAGRCGTCRCRLAVPGQAGEAGEEGGDGTPRSVLACQTRLTAGGRVEIEEPDEITVHPARSVRARVVALEAPTHDVRIVRLEPSKPLSFSPGQYASVQFADAPARPFSMASLPGAAWLEFHIRLVPGGQASGVVAKQLRLGDAVRVSGPLGSAYLRTAHTGPVLCVAGGTGLAPVLSILGALRARGSAAPVHLYFGVRSAQDVYGLEALRQLASGWPALQTRVVVAQGPAPAPHRTGLLPDLLAAELGDGTGCTGWRAYVCGAPGMVDAVTAVLRAKGIAERHVHADAFVSAAPAEGA